jgi:hypothetical protein
MQLVVNVVIYQVCWLACIIGAAQGMPMVGVGLVAIAAAYHLYNAGEALPEFNLLIIAAVIGALWDSLPVAMGWLVYPSGTLLDGAAPYWIVALWVAFATTFNVSLRWFKQHLLLAALFGAIGGPLAFLAGERLGGVEFTSYPAALTALAIGWGLLMPLMLLIAQRFNGFEQPQQTAPVNAANGE